MTKIISISITDAEKEFLDLMELSPSGLFKQKLAEVKETSYNYNKKLEIKDNAILRLNQMVEHMGNKLEEYSKRYGILE